MKLKHTNLNGEIIQARDPKFFFFFLLKPQVYSKRRDHDLVNLFLWKNCGIFEFESESYKFFLKKML